jgi:hypothetical protein
MEAQFSACVVQALQRLRTERRGPSTRGADEGGDTQVDEQTQATQVAQPKDEFRDATSQAASQAGRADAATEGPRLGALSLVEVSVEGREPTEAGRMLALLPALGEGDAPTRGRSRSRAPAGSAAPAATAGGAAGRPRG